MVRILRGSRVVEAPPGFREALAGRKVVMDVGTGDGRWPYEAARANPGTMFIGLDPDAEAMKDYAYRASRKPSRGGTENVVFVVSSIERPPPELRELAAEVHVIFPWAALLRGIVLADEAVLQGLSRVAKPGATVELVLTYDASHDRGAGIDQDLPSLDGDIIQKLREPFAKAGLEMVEVGELARDEALAIASTWGRRLLHGRPRRVYRVLLRRTEGRGIPGSGGQG